MKKLLGVLVCVGAMFLSSCGWTDYTYSLLPNGYEIHSNGGDNTSLCFDGSSYLVGTDYVEEFCNNDRYVCTKNKIVDEKTDDEGHKNIEVAEKFEYHIVDTQEQTVYGPYATVKDLNEAISDMGIENLCEWTPTWPAPEGAVYVGE